MIRVLLVFLLSSMWSCTSNKHEGHTETKEVLKKSEIPDMDELQLSDQQIQLGNITIDTIRLANMGNQTVLTAILNFDQTKTTAISARVMGRVEQLYFKNTGDSIRKGDKLYDLYSEELNNAKQEYLLASERRKTFSGNDLIDFSALLQSAKNKLTLWGMSNSQIMQLEKAGKSTPLTSFYSTESGYITTLDVKQGYYVMEGGTIVQLADLSTLWAEAQVYTSQFSQFRPNASAIVRIPELGDEAINGKISFVNPEVIPDSRINMVRVSIPNKGNRLKPGMAAYVYLNSDKHSSLALPVNAVIRDAKGATVWIKTGKNTFKSKMVVTGAEMNDRIAIKSGLAPGDLVVVTGAYLVNSEYIFKKGVNPMAGHDMSGM